MRRSRFRQCPRKRIEKKPRSIRKRNLKSNRKPSTRSRREIKLSRARSVRTPRDHVPNRDCYCGNLRAYEETQVLDREFTFWRRRLRLSRPRGAGEFFGSVVQKPLGSGVNPAKRSIPARSPDKPALAEPREVASHLAPAGLETERFNRFGSNVRHCFVY